MNLIKLLLYALSALALASCHKVTVVVEHVPENTPANAAIFVAGNFNYWDPGDRSFQFHRLDSTRYAVDLPAGWGTVAYKLTRGDWTSVETDACGHEIGNRLVNFFDNDTVYQKIDSWKDLGPLHCPKVVIRLRRVPKETPNDDPIFLAGNFNNWNDRDPNFRMKPDGKGNLMYTLGETTSQIEFKFTRGSWDREEADAVGNPVINRQFKPGTLDTLDVHIEGWKDIDPGDIARRVTFLINVPPTTPKHDGIYLTGNFNDWKPGDSNYRLKAVAPHQYSITLNKKQGKIQYKITRGTWNTEEVDSYGGVPGNHSLRTLNDTVVVNVARWKDDPSYIPPPPNPAAPGQSPSPPDVVYYPDYFDPETQNNYSQASRSEDWAKRSEEVKKLEKEMKRYESRLDEATKNLDLALRSGDKEKLRKAKAELKNVEQEYRESARQLLKLNQLESMNIYNRKAPVIGPVGPGRKWVTVTIRNPSLVTRKVWIRTQTPFDSTNRNYGITGIFRPGYFEQYTFPEGAVLYKTKGQYWDDARPPEKLVRRLKASDDGLVLDAAELEYK